MTIHNAGLSSLLTILIVLGLINLLLLFCINDVIVISLFMLISVIIFLFALNFYRSPKRIFLGETENAIVSPADGTIVAVEEVYEPEYFESNRLLVSVFMSVFNVHANWYPIEGRIILKKHHKGRFRAAYLPKSSTENERSTLVLRRNDGLELLVRQIAGAMARRIVTYPQVGYEGHLNDHFGFIKLGSRVDLYLPLDSTLKVVVGQKVKGGESLIGEVKQRRVGS